jgi:hypothetical protein
MIVLAQFLLAILAFLSINWLGRHALSTGYYQISFIAAADDAPAFNSVFRILAPLVFSVVTAGILYAIGLDGLVKDFYRVTVFYFLIRWGFNLAMGRGLLLLWGRQIFIAATSVTLSYLLYDRVLRYRHNVLPDPSNLANELWVVILLFLYATFNKVTWPFGTTAGERRRHYIRVYYRRYDEKYGNIIRRVAPNQFAEVVGFAILIYESFNRPPIYQAIERLLQKIGLSKSLGPMQVQTSESISNTRSIELGMRKVVADIPIAEQKLRRTYRYMNLDPDQAIPSRLYDALALDVAREYNIRSDYPFEVRGIFEQLVEDFYPDLKPKESETEGLG